MMKLFMLRVSLKERAQRDAFERRTQDGRTFSREEWLRDVFSARFEFDHRNSTLFFVPEPNGNTGLDEHLIVGWIARDRSVRERTAPWEGLDPTEHQSWQAALIMIDPTHHDDGQKVAFEHRDEVGRAAPVLASLARHLSDRGSEEPFSVSVYPIIQDRSFARFSEQHSGEIATITYDVAMPNMFGGPDDFSNELRLLRDRNNVSHVRTHLSSDGVIKTENSQLNEIANHVERGGGKIKARTIRGERYNSDDHAVTEEVDTEGTEPESPSYWERIKDALDRIF